MTTPALHFPHAQAPAPGTYLDVAEGVRWLRLPLPFALDHVNVWLLDGDDGWTLVDAGVADPRTIAALEAGLEAARAGRPIARVLVTHFHPDHVGNAARVCARWDAPLLMPRVEWLTARLLTADRGEALPAEWARFYRAAGLGGERLAAVEARGNAYPRGVPALPDALHAIAHGDALALGGRTWRVATFGGHSPALATLLRTEGDGAPVLVAGDQVLPSISPNVSVLPSEPRGDPLAEFLASLAALGALPADALVLPSHGRPYVGLHARAAALAAHHAERLEAARAACTVRPRTAAGLIDVLFPRPARAPLDAHQLQFAVGEAMAHANHLARRGALARVEDAGGVAWFGPAD